MKIPGLGAITIAEYQWSRPTTVLYPGGGKRELEYDGLMRLKTLTAKDPGGNSVVEYAYEYDGSGNIVSKTTGHGTYAYGYDGASRLTSADNLAGDDESYSYDEVGNRTSASNAAGEIVHNANNELERYGEQEYAYDANGNMTEVTLSGHTMFVYHYNADNRLIKVEGGNNNTIAEYYYDPFGRRLWKDVGGTRTYFFYSDEGLVAEFDSTGSEIRSYGYQPDSTWGSEPVWMTYNNAYYFYQNDHLGTPQKLVAQNGSVVWSATYSAFGEATVDTEYITNNLRFPGQYYDAETGLHYNHQRYYEPQRGRYITTDPIGFQGGDMNLYRYTENNPVNVIDPYGLLKREEVVDEGAMYSCNCGWIDTKHVGTGDLWTIAMRGITEYRDSGADIIDNLIVPQPHLLTYVMGSVRLKPHILQRKPVEQMQIALDIAHELELYFEKHQGEFLALGWYTHSSFSVEDLPSDFLGFVDAAKQIFDPEGNVIGWKELCDPLDKEASVKMFDYGHAFNRRMNAEILPVQNYSHEPQLWDTPAFREYWRYLGEEHPCECQDTSLPEVFTRCAPRPYEPGNPDYEWLSQTSHYWYKLDEGMLKQLMLDYPFLEDIMRLMATSPSL